MCPKNLVRVGEQKQIHQTVALEIIIADHFPRWMKQCGGWLTTASTPHPVVSYNDQLWMSLSFNTYWSFIDTKSPDIKDLTFELSAVASHWHQLGTYLSVPHDILSKIDADFDNSTRKLNEMLQYWLSNEMRPSWEKVIKALQKMNDHRKLCLRLKEKYNHNQDAPIPSQLQLGNYWWVMDLIYYFSS